MERSRRDRRIGRHHVAFYRGWLQGLDLKSLADRYLETGLDLRLAKATLAWLRDTLSQAALRQGRRGEARLLRLHLATGQAPTIPTEPVPSDPVSAWFDKPVADRMVLAGIPTIGALLDRIRNRGYRWWITVPKLGEKGAARIVAWLRGYESSLGPLPDHATAPVRSLPAPMLVQARRHETAIVPMDRLHGNRGLPWSWAALLADRALQKIPSAARQGRAPHAQASDPCIAQPIRRCSCRPHAAHLRHGMEPQGTQRKGVVRDWGRAG